jgi:hypothetical protein
VIVCGNCGAQNEDTDAFCGNCGLFLEWVGKRVDPSEAQPTPADEATSRAAAEAEAEKQRQASDAEAARRAEEQRAAAEAEAKRQAKEAEAARKAEEEPEDEGNGEGEGDEESEDEAPRRRRGRRGGRSRATTSRKAGKPFEATFDHGEEGYGLWLDPAVADDPVYAEHWAGHRPVEVVVEPDRIVIKRVGPDADGDDD